MNLCYKGWPLRIGHNADERSHSTLASTANRDRAVNLPNNRFRKYKYWVVQILMSISFAERLVLPEDVLISNVEGESVLLNLNSERYFGLDEVGTRMLSVLTTSNSIQTAYEALLERIRS